MAASFDNDDDMNGPDRMAYLGRKRKSPNTACDMCRIKKVRCDTNFPCNFCQTRNVSCTYEMCEALKAGIKKIKTEESTAIIVSPQTRLEQGMLANTSRIFYLETFEDQINPIYRVFDESLLETAEDMEESAMMEQTVMICLTARSLGHAEVCCETLNRAREHAKRLIDDFSVSAAVGYLLLGLYHAGADTARASHYASIASSLCKGIPNDHWKKTVVTNMISGSRVLEGPNRKPGPSLQDLMNSPLSPYSMFQPPFHEELLTRARTFPMYAPALNIFCSERFVSRFPVHERTNEFLDIEKLRLLMLCSDAGMRTQGGVDWNDMSPVATLARRAQLSGKVMRLTICTFGGLETLGAQCARDVLEHMMRYSLDEAAFGAMGLVQGLVTIMTFCTMFNRTPYEREPYQAFFAELITFITPMLERYPAFDTIHELLTAYISDDPPLTTQLPTRTDENEVVEMLTVQRHQMATQGPDHIQTWLGTLATNMISAAVVDHGATQASLPASTARPPRALSTAPPDYTAAAAGRPGTTGSPTPISAQTSSSNTPPPPNAAASIGALHDSSLPADDFVGVHFASPHRAPMLHMHMPQAQHGYVMSDAFRVADDAFPAPFLDIMPLVPSASVAETAEWARLPGDGLELFEPGF